MNTFFFKVIVSCCWEKGYCDKSLSKIQLKRLSGKKREKENSVVKYDDHFDIKFLCLKYSPGVDFINIFPRLFRAHR